ncbi:uncharacterized protein C8Q71DRAFT_449218 [Rhodofomes roseus]|uniref:Uncharacterized protein n=1 Tax=Rhodofomes roseus TaxID=34475 RepID=A0ABQ8JZD3_9APHY|nr:uncharacterized protein C8Q71DRAFT_449218 [Rhodofomes roseus]KAH9829109.1 hypothetical protein C8Q71DRAFT_449218 [Rhodofomes roseus]
MSAPEDEQEAVTLLRSIFTDNCFLVAAIAFYVFDRCICAGREIDLIWSRGYSLVSGFYALLEVFTVLCLSLTAAQNLLYLDCKVAVSAEIALQIITASYNAVIAVIAALRVYAVNGRDWRLSIVVFLLLLLRSGYDAFQGINIIGVAVPRPVGCVVETAYSVAIAFYILRQ